MSMFTAGLAATSVSYSTAPRSVLHHHILMATDVVGNGASQLPKIVKSHHIPITATLTVRGARPAIISHLIAGSCATPCEVSQPSSQKHKYLCAHRPQPCHATLVSKSLGLSEYSRSNLSATLDARRKALISEDKPIHTARSIFVKLDYLPKGTLSLSHAHGLEVPSNVNLPTLRDSIATHIAMSRCRSREALACSQISLQSESPVASGSDDPSTRSQLYRYLLNQIAPILTVRPLKRLLDLHGIRYVDTDNIRKIRKHLSSLKMCRR
ncbi:hypothetical protein B0H13DRAFT_1872219 [Mycena leptocephala]|nr:hypothetical protein B0H13DRAFT_1872219 [Mycena leptocephala]